MGIAGQSYRSADEDYFRDGKQLGMWLVALAILTPLVQRLILKPVSRALLKEPKAALAKGRSPAAKETTAAGAKLRLDRIKFVTSATKLVSYCFFFSLAIWSLKGQWGWFWDVNQYAVVFKNVPWRLRTLYVGETAYYLYTLVTMFFEPKMKDRNQMIAHHIFTLTLLVSSYYGSLVKYGTSIMVLHDFSDPWMEAAKLCNYTGFKAGSNVFFTIFALSFVILRVYIYPAYVIRSVYISEYLRAEYPYYTPTLICLIGLWVLHVFWTFLIYRVFYENVILNKNSGDVRED